MTSMTVFWLNKNKCALKTKRYFIYAVILILVGFVSCKKVPQHIGNTLQPSGSYIKVAFTDDNDIVTEIERIDSLSTKSASLSLLGSLNDPHFGRSDLSFYTQIGLTSNSVQWGENAVVDSIVLQMVYSGYYGDTLSPLTLRVYEVLEDMNSADSSTYYSNTILSYGNELANYTFSPRPKTKSNIDDDSLTNAVIRIPIDVSLGQRFIDDGETAFASNTAFMSYFKGLYLTCDPATNTGSICYFNTLNTKSYMRVYYHNDYDTNFYNLNVSDKYVRFNHFEHDYGTAQAPITFNDTANNPYLYVQSTAGVRSRLQFPNIAKWADSLNTNVLINEARLILTGVTGNVNGVDNDTTMFTPPAQLVAVKANNDGSYTLLPDQLVGTNYFGGYYDPDTKQVWFRISEYIQDLILAGPDAEDYGIYIYTYAGVYNAKRWIFGGADNEDPAKKVRLEIVYSQIDD